jgi:hypothetical protein
VIDADGRLRQSAAEHRSTGGIKISAEEIDCFERHPMVEACAFLEDPVGEIVATPRARLAHKRRRPAHRARRKSGKPRQRDICGRGSVTERQD